MGLTVTSEKKTTLEMDFASKRVQEVKQINLSDKGMGVSHALTSLFPIDQIKPLDSLRMPMFRNIHV